MNGLESSEFSDLVELWRQLSPAALSVELPHLPADLEALTHTKLASPPRAVFFDIYGTLLVSATGGEPNQGSSRIDEATKARETLELELELNNLGYRGSRLEFAQSLSVRIKEDRDSRLAQTPHPEIDIEGILGEMLPELSAPQVRRLAIVHEAWANPCALMPGATLVLSLLSGKGLRLGLISNAQFYTPILLEALLGAPLERFGLDPHLSTYSYEIQTAKPSTIPFEMVKRKLHSVGIHTEETMFVGNSSTNDVIPAQTLGFKTALFAGDKRSFRPVESNPSDRLPDLVLRSLEELPERLGL